MTLRTWVVILFVGVMNIAMNVALKRAAGATSMRRLLRTPHLWFALVAGTLSIGLLLLTYRSGIPLARAVLLLGATSVLLGVGAGMALGERLTLHECGVLLFLLAFYVSAWVQRA